MFVADVERDVPDTLQAVVKGFIGYDPLTIDNCISSLDLESTVVI